MFFLLIKMDQKIDLLCLNPQNGCFDGKIVHNKHTISFNFLREVILSHHV